ncbi:signal peptidase II [Paenibacillus humicola]|uniref:signal peptidase II n=1 Tax=Paenibacillus humicola TaxID=3110540 RepID=UPI003B82C9AD
MKYYYYWIALFVFAIDFVSKKMIEANFVIGQKMSIIGDFFVITFLKNQGAAFGILQRQQWLFVLITLLVVAGIVWYMAKNRNTGKPLLLIGLGLVLGGAIGNFLDRALYGEVTDFLQFTFGSYVFPIFNLADSGITCGVALILLDALISSKKENGEPNGQHERKEPDGSQPVQ